jgi:RNA polymerase sigma-70 factor (ECF subfamily)
MEDRPVESPSDKTLPAADPLLDALRARDPVALDTLYRKYASFVHGLASRVVRDAGEAEEVTHDVFVHVWQHAGRFDPERGTLASWLVTLARSRGIDRLRARVSRERRIEGLAIDMASDPGLERPDPLDEAMESERRDRVRAALAALSPEQRQAIEVAYYEGLSQSEISVRLGVPLGTIKSRIRQGMLRLRQILDGPAG